MVPFYWNVKSVIYYDNNSSSSIRYTDVRTKKNTQREKHTEGKTHRYILTWWTADVSLLSIQGKREILPAQFDI